MTSSLAGRLLPLATGAAGTFSVTSTLEGLSAPEGRLLRALLTEPAPLLALDSNEARIACWVLMRLSLSNLAGTAFG